MRPDSRRLSVSRAISSTSCIHDLRTGPLEIDRLVTQQPNLKLRKEHTSRSGVNISPIRNSGRLNRV